MVIYTSSQIHSSRGACIPKYCCNSCTFVSARETLTKKVSFLGNVSSPPRLVGGVTFANPLDSVTNVDNALAVAIDPPVGGKLQIFASLGPSGCKSQSGFHLTEGLHAPFSGKAYSHQIPLDPDQVCKSHHSEGLAGGPNFSSSKKAVEKVPKPSSLGFYNRLFLVPKPNKRFWISVS